MIFPVAVSITRRRAIGQGSLKGSVIQASAVCQLTLLLARFVDGSGRRQDAAVSPAAFSAATHAFELFPDTNLMTSPMFVLQCPYRVLPAMQ
jgi:hypothetical protein